MTLTLNVQGQIGNLLYLSQKWSSCHEIIRFDLGHDLDHEFSRSDMEFAITQSKWSDCHETKSKHIDITLGLQCDHQILPWPWPLPLIFKIKYWICYISAKNFPIAMKHKANILFNLKATSVAIRFHIGHELDLEFSRSNMEFTVSQPKMAQLPRNEKRPWTWP